MNTIEPATNHDRSILLALTQMGRIILTFVERGIIRKYIRASASYIIIGPTLGYNYNIKFELCRRKAGRSLAQPEFDHVELSAT